MSGLGSVRPGVEPAETPPIRGRFRDVLRAEDGSALLDTGWRSNVIVDSAWRLVSALLANERGVRGILYWALGRGDPGWDEAPIQADPRTSRLREEVDRIPVGREAIRHLDLQGRSRSRPGPTLEVGLTVSWEDGPRTLREFGLVGGDAEERIGTGYLVNYVIHPRLEVSPGRTLERRLRLTFQPEGRTRWIELPEHWLGEAPVNEVDGVGPVFAASLGEVGVHTLGDLAALEPSRQTGGIPFVRLVELRAKARLALRAATEIRAGPDFHPRTAWEVLITPSDELAGAVNASAEEVERVREKVSALELTLGHPFLRRITVGELMGVG